MADLPRYQQTGRIFADVPQLDFANIRESFKKSQSMATGLDRLSTFASKAAGEETERAAQQAAIDQPITLEQLKEAEKSGITAEDIVKSTGGGKIWQDTMRKFQAEQLRSQLEVQANTEALKISNQVKTGELTDFNEIKGKFNALTEGMSKPLAGLDPETAIKFQHSTGALIKGLEKVALDKLYDDYKFGKQVETNDYFKVASEMVNSIYKTETNPDVVNTKLSLLRKTLGNVAKEGGTDFGLSTINSFDKLLEDKKSNYFEEIALKNDFAKNPTTGMPDIALALNKLNSGDLGEGSQLWATYDQDKKDKVIKTIYDRITQNYTAAAAQDKYQKDVKEKQNLQTLIDLRTPGRVKFSDRQALAEKLALDNTITDTQYAELIDPTVKEKPLTAQQKFWKNEAAYKIRTGRLTTLQDIQKEYGNRLPIDAIGDLLGPLATEDGKAADKYKAKYSGADYDPYHLQDTTQKKFIEITDATDKKLKELNKDGTPVYSTELAAAKAAADEIEASKVTQSNIAAQKRKFNSLNAFGFNPDNGGIDDWAKRQYGANYKTNKKYLSLKDDYDSYNKYKRLNSNKKYTELPSDEELKAK